MRIYLKYTKDIHIYIPKRQMSKRKFDVKLRKVGNSYVVTIPKDTIDRFDLKEGDFLALDIDSDEIKKTKGKSKK